MIFYCNKSGDNVVCDSIRLVQGERKVHQIALKGFGKYAGECIYLDFALPKGVRWRSERLEYDREKQLFSYVLPDSVCAEYGDGQFEIVIVGADGGVKKYQPVENNIIISRAINALECARELLPSTADKIYTEISLVNESLDDIREQNTDIDNRLQMVENMQITDQEQLEDLGQKTLQNTAKIDMLCDKQSADSQRIDGISASLASAERAVAQCRESIGTNGESIASIQRDIAAHKESIRTINTTISSVESVAQEVQSNTADIGGCQRDIASLQHTCGSYGANIERLSSASDMHTVALAEMESAKQNKWELVYDKDTQNVISGKGYPGGIQANPNTEINIDLSAYSRVRFTTAFNSTPFATEMILKGAEKTPRKMAGAQLMIASAWRNGEHWSIQLNMASMDYHLDTKKLVFLFQGYFDYIFHSGTLVFYEKNNVSGYYIARIEGVRE